MTRLQILFAFLTTLLASAPAMAVYSPELGRWRQRDPIGYVDGSNVFGYAKDKPTFAQDPLGLTIRITGNTSQKNRIVEAMNEMCPDGDFKINPDGSVRSDNDKFMDCDGLNEEDSNPELCNCLRNALKNNRDYHIKPYVRDDGGGLGNDYVDNDDYNTQTHEIRIGKGFKRNSHYPGYYEDEDAKNKIRPAGRNRVPWNLATALAHELCAHGEDGLRHPNDDTRYTEDDPVLVRENEYRRELGPEYGIRTR
jgi:hypothetical protein